MARNQQRPPPASRKLREVKIYGDSACAALWERRPDDIIRAYVLASKKGRWGPLLKWCAAQRRAYHLVEAEELQRVSGSQHHEGICLLARERPLVHESELAKLLQLPGKKLVFYLDGVENPHNIGAILRVAAHFGCAAVLLPQDAEVSLSGSTCRVAEGGAEIVPIIKIRSIAPTLALMKKSGFKIYATSSHVEYSLFDAKLAGDALFFFGAEGSGLSKEVMRQADRTVVIPGSGLVESMNVACAAAVVAGEWWRQNPR